MSTHSAEITSIINEKLAPKMRELSLDIANIEPFSHSSAHLEDNKRQLDYLSMIYDFLYEYQVGDEELDRSKIVNVVRLLDVPTREKRSTDYLGSTPSSFTQVKTGYTVFIDKKEVTVDNADETYLMPGTAVSITVTYTPAEPLEGVGSMTLTSGTLSQATEGLTIGLQNKLILMSDGGGSLVLTVQALEDGVGITSAQVITIPIADLVGNVIYHGVGAAALLPADIQNLTTLYEAKGTKTITFSPSSEVLYFAYPSTWGVLTAITDQNDFDIMDDFSVSTEPFVLDSPNYGGGTANYYVYEFDNTVTADYFEVTFTF